MAAIAARFAALREKIGGNRDKAQFEFTFGRTVQERNGIARPAPHIRRILAELAFAVQLQAQKESLLEGGLDTALSILEADMAENGTLTRGAAARAEAALLPYQEAAKAYEVLCAAHAHIDMNWMWSFDETVAATLATFRTMLALMDEYPDFCFSQSQASVYRIVEQYAPEMMPHIQARIREGRWEVTASAWVETDKNMPDTESLLRHIRMTRDYLRDVWGIDPASVKVDFSPDTFGHSAQVPEINAFGQVPYYYHCRGSLTEDVLYRWRAPSGSEVLVHREPYWYNSGITEDIGIGAVMLARHSGGLKTSLIVYGVGDHGGGPTRRDIEALREMQAWPVFPRVTFGTLAAYFARAEAVRESLPVVEGELNTIFTGCYTTQSRIKRGNRRTEAALLDAQALDALAHFAADAPSAPQSLDAAWRSVLFTHFHDILTGSCVPETREHAMGLYQEAIAHARTVQERAMRAISDRIDTSAIAVDTDSLDSQSEGAGAGYGVEHFTGAAIAERGRGRVRVYHVFNPLPHARAELVELTVWDWPYDWKRLRLRDAGGAPLPFQVVDRVSQHYWSHDYFRVLVQVEAPAGGYTTVVLEEAPAGQPCVYRNDRDRILLPAAPLVLENEALRAAFDPESGMLLSLLDKAAGQERVDSAQGAGFQVKLAEPNSMSAWVIGRHVQSVPVVTMRVRPLEGSLRQGLVVEQRTLGSTLKATVTLDPTATGLAYDLEVDWHEVSGGDRLVPVLTFGVPLNAAPDTVRMDIPAGSVDRAQRADDLPGLTHAAAVYGGRALALVTDCKYGYRAQADVLSATLINTASFPDPYPERGIHHVKLWLHAGAGDPAALKQAAQRYTRPLAYISATAHEGPLPAAASLLAVEAEGAVVTSAGVTEDGALLVRLYEASGKAGQASMALPFAPRRAVLVDLDERETGSATVEGGMVRVAIKPYQVLAVKVYADA